MRRLAFAALAALLGLVVVATSGAQSEPTVTVEVRVLQNVEDGREIHISARPAGGLWQTLGRIPLALDDGFSPRGKYRYGDISVDVRLPNRSTPVTVEVWVWQDVGDDQNIYISARGSLGEWDTLGTIALPLDDGLIPDRTLRFGDVRLEAPLPPEGVDTLAGQAGEWGYADGPGTEARFGQQGESSIRDLGLAAAPDGSVIVADRAHGAVRRVAPDGAVSTIAGGNRSALPSPSDVAVDAEGNIYVAVAWAGGLIRKFSPDGRVTSVVAGGGPEGSSFEIPPDGPAEEAYFRSVRGVALGPEGDLFIAEQFRIRRLSPSGRVSNLAGGSGLGYRDGPGAQAQFTWLEDIAVDDAGNVYVIDRAFVPGEVGSFATIRKVDTDGVVTTLFRSELPFSGGVLAGPTGLAVTDDGELLISNTGRNQIVRLTADGTLEAVAGSGEDGYVDGPRGAAALSLPGSLAVLPDGSIVVTDQAESLLRVIAPDPGGSDSTDIALAGGEPVPRVEGVRAGIFARHLPFIPELIALDSTGNVVVADAQYNSVRRVSPDGTVTTLAGANGAGFRDGPGDEAQFKWPRGIAVHADGSLYVADYGNDRIRKVSPDGSVTTVDPADGFEVRRPQALAFDDDGNLLIAEAFPGRLYRVSADGETSTLLAEGLQFIHAIAVGDGGDAYLTARRQGRAIIVKVTPDGDVSTAFQDRQEHHGGVLTLSIGGIAVAPDGTLYVVDKGYGHVVRISPDGAVAIVVEHDVYSPDRNEQSTGILVMPDGSLLVSTIDAIWKITFEDEADE